ncbi:MAG TPA: type II toxin-antitoxin system RelE/ParE family toxin [Alcanivorax sp.]|nr:type II toxin-antitoxin system RelE/ParE family toxin [Alcanivorax sp.]
MIKSFRHKGLQRFFTTGSTVGIQANHAPKLRRQLARLNVCASPQEMDSPGWGLYPLKDALTGHYSVCVSGNWRLTFKFKDGDAILVDYQDDH